MEKLEFTVHMHTHAHAHTYTHTHVVSLKRRDSFARVPCSFMHRLGIFSRCNDPRREEPLSFPARLVKYPCQLDVPR